MKIKLCLITVLFIQSTIYSQINSSLIQNTWIKTRSERVDGSKIIDHAKFDRNRGIYIFSHDSVRMIVDPNMETYATYRIIQNYLVLHNSLRYLIEKLNDKELVYSEIKEGLKEDLADDEINRYYFMSSVYYYDSLVENNLIKINGDTIIADIRIYPFMNKGPINNYLRNGLGNLRINGIINGEFIVSPMNNISDVKINGYNLLDNNTENNCISVIESSSGQWILPELMKPYFFKVKFNMPMEAGKSNMAYYSVGGIYLNDSNQKNTEFPEKQIRLANGFYNKGLTNIEKGKFNESIECFTKCIESDSIYINAYYNRAYVYYTINNFEKACNDWKYLKELGQMKAKEYYESKCTK